MATEHILYRRSRNVTSTKHRGGEFTGEMI